jgi:DnaJ-class molecular chaperone
MGFLLILVVLAVAGYLFSLRIHPLTKCRVCNASGRHFGAIYTYGHRRCRACGGTGRKDRLGAKLFYGGTENGIYTKK